MSAPVSGKFQDHYIALGVETNADADTIQAAYAKLAERYHPDNPATGDETKFAAVSQAYEVLTDPAQRAAFDKVKGVDLEAGSPKFTGVEFFQALAQSEGLRSAVLCILYDRRRVKSYKPSLSMKHLEGMLYVTGESLNFALWYLKKRVFVTYDDKSAMEITVEGMDFLEQNRPSAETVMLFIKPEALATPVNKTPLPEAPPEPEIRLSAPILRVLNRALQRSLSADEPAERR